MTPEERAEDLARRLFPEGHQRDHARTICTYAITSAVAAERKRAAEIARNAAMKGLLDNFSGSTGAVCQAIAAAIEGRE